ncbi:hypothetical protein HQ346_02515 [Rhodococcus sp. BP-252]|uniref:hypothetical protein n=1 Tax=Nocardiaceae TaxID=85025 RepID=UPI000AE85B1B|nr:MULTISPECIES: hypothetical protein [Rhodococcus]MBY6410426.1 hypothetical protein [Rhodococcus sp. BP-320]MBY6416308.1 hypothetical protein [Rhodococcus sp. BP-321]MBY6420303.1 hypothetical protein [Rhodococcus sp. BP-324]MBY6424982.1 hypothetical protein [Rhodococcus sp. BP-323]MBY6430312.1 hypothetical protein [Rhodococcus sp. BP-322]
MASLTQRLKNFAGSPQGRTLIAKAKAYASKPENQAKLKSIGSRITGKDTRR